jgi:hypothetical protein
VVAANKEVEAFNVRLDASVHVELDDCKALAEERQKFAAGLKLPQSRERWWGRP